MATQAVDRFQPAAVSSLPAVRGAASAAVFVPTDFGGVMEMAKLMAQSDAAVPKHLRHNPGMCLSVAMTAYQNAFNPFLLAGDTYVVNDILAYGAKSIGAMVDNSPQLAEPLDVAFSGDWPDRVALVTGKFRGVEKPRTVEVKANTITTRNSPLWKAQPDQQLLYYSKRAWARAWMPGVLLGMLAEDEVAAERAMDITPPRPTRASMGGAGFEPDSATATEVRGEVDPVTGEIHEPPAEDDEVPARDVATEVADQMTKADADLYMIAWPGKWPTEDAVKLFSGSVANADTIEILDELIADNTGAGRLLTVLHGMTGKAKTWASDLVALVNDRKTALMSPEKNP